MRCSVLCLYVCVYMFVSVLVVFQMNDYVMVCEFILAHLLCLSVGEHIYTHCKTILILQQLFLGLQLFLFFSILIL